MVRLCRVGVCVTNGPELRPLCIVLVSVWYAFVSGALGKE